MNEQTTSAVKNESNEISLGFLFAIALKRFWYLVMAVVVGALCALAFTKIFMTPIFSSTAQFRVENTSDNLTSTGSGYLMGAEYSARNYVEQIKGNQFLGDVVELYNASITDPATGALTAEAVEKGLSTLTWERLADMITVAAKADSNTFSVKVASTNQEEAYLVLKVFEELCPQELTKESMAVALNNGGVLAKSADSPNTTMNVFLGAVLMAVLTYGVFFLLAIMDNTVYEENTLKQHYNVPVVGVLPEWDNEEKSTQQGGVVSELKGKVVRAIRNPLERRGTSNFVERDYEGRILSSDTPFFIAESFKTLRTNLSYVSAKSDGTCVYGMTSAYAGAGKSMLTANIAISFAQLEKRVLLIDADMRCPVQHKIFKTDKKEVRGLSEILAGIDGATFDECVCHNEKYGFDVLYSGHIPPNPSELLSSKQMQALIERLHEQYDCIFLDLPPVLETTDASVLSGVVNCYAIVVRAGHSKLNAVTDAIETMRAAGAHVGGFVLNDVNFKRGLGGYYKSHRYGRYSRYGRYGRYGQKSGKQ